MDDWRLLQQYIKRRSQEAFGEIVRRHLSLVYSTSLREVRDPQIADDVTQSVFIILAEKAPSLTPATSLPGWLFLTARLTAKNALRSEARRRIRETIAMEMAHTDRPSQSEQATWQCIEPLLHEALGALEPADRNAILLRFFDQMSLRATGDALGISESTAQKRVSRALEKLRHQLQSAGVVVSIALLIALLTSKANAAVPEHLAESVLRAVTAVRAGADAGGGSSTMAPTPQGSSPAGLVRGRSIAKVLTAACVTTIVAVVTLIWGIQNRPITRTVLLTYLPPTDIRSMLESGTVFPVPVKVPAQAVPVSGIKQLTITPQDGTDTLRISGGAATVARAVAAAVSIDRLYANVLPPIANRRGAVFAITVPRQLRIPLKHLSAHDMQWILFRREADNPVTGKPPIPVQTPPLDRILLDQNNTGNELLILGDSAEAGQVARVVRSVDALYTVKR